MPSAWQGWVVMAVHLICLVLAAVVFPPVVKPLGFAIVVVGATPVLVLVCWRTGEPPSWRWGTRS